MRKIGLGVLTLGLAAVCLPTLAQETQEAEREETARDERPHIQVLRNPYDLASFYRSSSGQRGFSYGFGYADPYQASFRPDLRGRFFTPMWSSGFGAYFGVGWEEGWRWDARSRGWSFDRRRSDSRAPRPSQRR